MSTRAVSTDDVMHENEAPIRGDASQVWTFPPQAESVGQARRLVCQAAEPYIAPELLETVVLLASELVTNAVVHSASSFEVAVGPGSPGFTVAVTDIDTGDVTTGNEVASPMAEGGRGLLLVRSLADAWGTEHSGGRKTVWFRVGQVGSPSAVPVDPAPAAKVNDLESTGGEPGEARVLSSLFLSPTLEASLRPEQQLEELLRRLVSAMRAAGASMQVLGTPGLQLCAGRLSGDALEEPLDVCGQTFGRLRVFACEMDGVQAEAFMRVAAQRLAVTVAAYRLAFAIESRQASQDLLADATELLSATATVAHVLALAAQLSVPRLAEWCVAYSVNDRGEAQRVTVVHQDERHLDELTGVAAADASLNAAVSEAISGLAPSAAPVRTVIGGQGYDARAFPLAARGRAGGAVLLGRREPFVAAQYLATVELSRRAGMALENARLHDEVSDAAGALRASLLPSSLPELKRLQFEASYRTASRALLVGGDFYDVVSVDDGSVVMFIGDVCGKGAGAAAIARTSRDLLRFLLGDGWSTVDALRRLNSELLAVGGDDRYCTLAAVRFVPAPQGGTFQVCLAGHPQPVLFGPGRPPALVGTVGSFVGILPDSLVSITETEIPVAAGQSLLLYTDGVTESRRGLELFDQHRLVSLLRRLGGAAPRQVADAVEAAAMEFSGNVLRDDLAVLVCRVQG